MNNPVRFDTEENYQNDLGVIKAKFTQLLENDVRQFAILADDASAPAHTVCISFTDLTRWHRRTTYPDLKTDLMFCPSDYGGNGSSAQLKELNKAEDNVSIVMTEVEFGRSMKILNNFMNIFLLRSPEELHSD